MNRNEEMRFALGKGNSLSVNRFGITALQLYTVEYKLDLQQEDFGAADRKAKMIQLFLFIFQRAKAALLY